MGRPLLLIALCTVGVGAIAASAQADVVTLATGRVMSVAAIRFESAEAVLTLRGGGEIRCPLGWIANVAPDDRPDEPVPVRAAPGSAQRSVPTDERVPYADLIEQLAGQHAVDPALVHAVVRVESAYRSTARSRRGAMGLMQLMPATARQYGVVDAFDPEANLSAGIRHLKSLLDRYALGDALAAYNAGEGAVRRFRGVPPFPETVAYVQAVLAAARGDGR